jgi:hypothetical protein
VYCHIKSFRISCLKSFKDELLLTEILDERELINNFGGYGKVTQDLVAFINEFYEK